MNYIREINGFERWLETHQLPTTAQLLWYKLLYWSSRSGWQEWTQVDNRRLMVSLQIAREASLAENRDRLVNAGLIAYQRGKKGCPGRYHIISFEKNTSEYPCKLNVQNEGQSEGYSEVYSEVQTVDIINNKKKKKLKKSITNVIPEKSAPKLELEDLGEELKAALENYIAHREAIGRPLTTAALDMLLKRLEELAPEKDTDKVAVLEQSIRNGWKDIYALDKSSMDSSSASFHSSKNRFHNFDQAETDYDALMIKKVRARMAES